MRNCLVEGLDASREEGPRNGAERLVPPSQDGARSPRRAQSTHNSHRPRRASLAPRRESYAITRRSKKYLSTQRTHAHVHTTHDDDAHTHGICHTGTARAPDRHGTSRRRARRGKSATLSASFSANSAARAPQPAPQSMYKILPFGVSRSRMTGHAAVDQFSIALCGSTSPDPSPSDPTLQPRGLQASPDLPNPTDSPRMRRLTPPPPSAAWPHYEHRSGGQNPCPRSRSLCLRGPCRCVSRDCPSSAEVHT